VVYVAKVLYLLQVVSDLMSPY